MRSVARFASRPRQPTARVARHAVTWPPVGGDGERLGRSGWPGRGPTPRERPVQASLPIHLRGADLDGTAIARRWDASGHLDGRVEIVGLQDEPAADSLLHPDERAVRRQRLTAFDPHGGRVLRQTHRQPGGDTRRLVDSLVVGVDLLLLRFWQRGLSLKRGALIDQHDVFHRYLLVVTRLVAVRRTASREIYNSAAQSCLSGPGFPPVR